MNFSSNHHRKTAGRLVLGALVLLAAGCASNTPAPVTDRGTNTLPRKTPPKAGFHVVEKGETIYSISRRFGVAVPDIIRWNNLMYPNQIEVGQELRIAQDTAVPPSTGVVVKPIETTSVEVPPVSKTVPVPQLYATPKGGKLPYSDENWSAIRNGDQVVVPSTQPSPPLPAEKAPEADHSIQGEWLWPAEGNVIAGFGNTSKGVDIAGDIGATVIASSSGKVVYAGSGLRGYGKLVIIKHESDFLTAYAHNRELMVKEGDSVKKGQKIAELGNTDADRPKLHFEIRRNGKPVDPMKYLPKR